ncbi:hypothetical protein LCGC14_1208080 [marine sediment metagenome]|uniref:Uncharacterized protein n=1 Tax=marine sediment metagenome TaxID=412755 RepID=A0A0F9PJJ2_9ZZZZ
MKIKILDDTAIESIKRKLARGFETDKSGMVVLHIHDEARAIAQAQARYTMEQVIEWRNTECTEHPHVINISGREHKMMVMHNDCEQCWQELPQLAEGE